ncbi:hypothetical protein AAMO2058_000969900 [Amorphochlora amoebiformis]
MLVLSAWSLEALIVANWRFNVVYIIGMCVGLVYKALRFDRRLETEICILLLFIMLFDPLRLYIGSRSNKLSNGFFLLVFSLMCGMTVITAVYFILWQTITMRIETALNCLMAIFSGGEAFIALIQVLRLIQLVPRALVL